MQDLAIVSHTIYFKNVSFHLLFFADCFHINKTDPRNSTTSEDTFNFAMGYITFESCLNNKVNTDPCFNCSKQYVYLNNLFELNKEKFGDDSSICFDIFNTVSPYAHCEKKHLPLTHLSLFYLI